MAMAAMVCLSLWPYFGERRAGSEFLALVLNCSETKSRRGVCGGRRHSGFLKRFPQQYLTVKEKLLLQRRMILCQPSTSRLSSTPQVLFVQRLDVLVDEMVACCKRWW